MKKITVLFAAVMAMLVAASPLSAQTRQQKKDAKKEAMSLEKQGFQTMGMPIIRQLEESYAKMSERNADGTAKYLFADAVVVSQTYTVAQMEAVNVAKVRLAGQVKSTIMSEAKTELANSQLNAEDAATVEKVLEKSTSMVAQKLSNVIMAREYFRVLDNKNYEYRILILYDAKSIQQLLVEEASQELKQALGDLNPNYEKVLKEIVNGIAK